MSDLSAYLDRPEADCVRAMVDALVWDAGFAARVREKTVETIEAMRGAKRKSGSIEGFFQAYSLSSEEGIALMCLAEALLRIPDARTADAMIRDKVTGSAWVKEAVAKDDWLMRLAGLGLEATRGTLESPLSRLGAPVIRAALVQGMKLLGGQFVLGQDIREALKRADADAKGRAGLSFSYDMLGEGARTSEDAQQYFDAYAAAIDAIGYHYTRTKGARPGISVKLSALHPRYHPSQEDLCVPTLTHRLLALCRQAANYDMALTVDAEEVPRLELSLAIIRNVLSDVSLGLWDGFGLAVQAYGKRTPALIDRLVKLAREKGRKIQVRLVKGAYWDSEIKRAQILGLADYPVYTRKNHTDLCFLFCAQKLLQARDVIYPMFGTHNAYTVEAILQMAQESRGGFEFQRLHGMGEALYDQLMAREDMPVRVYAPVGNHRDLLPYLVRRLLENGANSSFVNKVFDPAVAPSELGGDPVEKARRDKGLPHPQIPLPARIFPDRANSHGLDMDDAPTRQLLLRSMEEAYERRELFAGSLIGGRLERSGLAEDIYNPADKKEVIGTAYRTSEMLVDQAFTKAQGAFAAWSARPAQERAAILNKIADLYEANTPLLLSLCVKEAGKTLPDALAELREAVDFCRYYAARGAEDFHENGRILASYTGESNRILLQGRGVFVCISPWNFPLAIFTGQVVAALMAGNAVIAKPAEQTPFVALTAVQLMHRAGIPEDVLALLIGDGGVGERMVAHRLVGGVAFTGSTMAAQAINRALAAREGAIVPLIAETGGQNAMIVDSSALPEQVTDDVIASAFGAAGQRCSALRVLFVQEEIADRLILMLQGALTHLRLGDPFYYSTDIGPVIDEEALESLQRHKTALEGMGRFVAEAQLSEELKQRGHFFAPLAYEIDDIAQLKREVFGPILHIIRYRARDLSAVVRAINDTGYGLTFGVHSRIDHAAEELSRDIACGNIYVNRTMTGAVVGVQPFGGSGLSGTGPKAGGPHYLHRFATEKTISVNTTATGGNASLVMLGD